MATAHNSGQPRETDTSPERTSCTAPCVPVFHQPFSGNNCCHGNRPLSVWKKTIERIWRAFFAGSFAACTVPAAVKTPCFLFTICTTPMMLQRITQIPSLGHSACRAQFSATQSECRARLCSAFGQLALPFYLHFRFTCTSVLLALPFYLHFRFTFPKRTAQRSINSRTRHERLSAPLARRISE